MSFPWPITTRTRRIFRSQTITQARTGFDSFDDEFARKRTAFLRDTIPITPERRRRWDCVWIVSGGELSLPLANNSPKNLIDHQISETPSLFTSCWAGHTHGTYMRLVGFPMKENPSGMMNEFPSCVLAYVISLYLPHHRQWWSKLGYNVCPSVDA